MTIDSTGINYCNDVPMQRAWTASMPSKGPRTVLVRHLRRAPNKKVAVDRVRHTGFLGATSNQAAPATEIDVRRSKARTCMVKKSVVLTACIVLLLVAVCFLWFATRPSIDEDTKTIVAATPDVSDQTLLAELDDIVMKAENNPTDRLPKVVTSADQALKHANKDWAKDCRVLEHKGWWVVAWQGSGSQPALWFYGFAIRKNSKDYYAFGSW
jgi:hypothetical protein